jgi:hypothetical protein
LRVLWREAGNPIGKQIKPAAHKLGIDKRVGWHTFRHTYSTLLKSTGADLKVMQELMRHASVVLTLNHYTQAMTPAKRAATDCGCVSSVTSESRRLTATATNRDRTREFWTHFGPTTK